MVNRLADLGRGAYIGPLEVAAYVQQQGELGRQQGLQRQQQKQQNMLAQLSSQAYSAAPEQQQSILGQMAAISPQAAQAQQQQFQSQEDRRNKLLANMSSLLVNSPEQARPGLYQQMVPTLQRLGINAPAAYDATTAPQIDQTAQALFQAFNPQAASTMQPRVISPGSALVNGTGDVLYERPAATPRQSVHYETGPDGTVYGITQGEDGTLAASPVAGVRARVPGSGGGSSGGSSSGHGRAPSGYQWTPDGNLAPIPGGPADKSGNGGNGAAPSLRPMPPQALRMMQDSREALSVAEGIDQSLGGILGSLQSGKLKLGPAQNFFSQAQNAIGESTPNSRAYDQTVSSLEKLRNDSLRLNKGVQTEGDAQRVWNELMANLNDGKNVAAQLTRIRAINSRAIQLHRENMQSVLDNYGRGGGSVSGGGQQGIPQQAIEYLRQNPGMRQQFEQKYRVSADQFLR